MFGDTPLRELTFKVIKEAFARMPAELAGRTVRNVHSTLRSILIEAAEDGLIDTAPTPLSARRDHLPPPVDKDPAWRDSARFDRAEIARLIGCDSILSLRRVLYATYFLTGSRFAELLPLRVSDYAPLEPWPGLTIAASKVGRHAGRRMRHLPVFPELRAWLDWWLAGEYAFLYGREPQPDDLLFPTLSVIRRNRGEAMCSHNEIYKQWQRNDLPAAGLAHRRLHDARRTFISVLRSEGVPDKSIRAVTHASTGDRILDAYTTWEWAGLCAELGRVTWGLPSPPTRTPPVPESAGGAGTACNKLNGDV
jgi:integrase